MAKKLTRGQYWEIIIVVVILMIIAYRVALVYDFVPEEYQPSTVIGEGYVELKKGLQADVDDQGPLSDTAKWTLTQLNAIEKYLYEQKLRYARAKMISERCQENMIFRFFMYIGDEENTDCTKSNMVLENAIKDINKETRKNNKSNAPPSIAPQIPEQPQASPAPNN